MNKIILMIFGLAALLLSACAETTSDETESSSAQTEQSEAQADSSEDDPQESEESSADESTTKTASAKKEETESEELGENDSEDVTEEPSPTSTGEEADSTEEEKRTFVLEDAGMYNELVYYYSGDEVLRQTSESIITYEYLGVTSTEEAEALIGDEVESYENTDGITHNIEYSEDSINETLEVDYNIADLEEVASLEGSEFDSETNSASHISMEQSAQQLIDSGYEEITSEGKTASEQRSSGSSDSSQDGVSAEFENALASAENYSKMLYMSKQGIFDQLTSEYGDQFPDDAAQYAIDNMEADWNENALKSAQNYQESLNMSRDAIWDQLTSEYGEQFTDEQADYALANLESGGTGSEDQSASDNARDDVPSEFSNALASAETYSDMMHMSKQGIYDQLTSEYGDQFPADAAQYAIDNIEADWNENALQSARSYQETMNMSQAELWDQLTSEYGEQFTEEQANYAIDNLE